MRNPSVRWLSLSSTAAGIVMLLTSCAVGPDFVHPAAPETDRYTKEKLAPVTSSTDAPTGHAQRFVEGRDLV